MEKHLNLKHWKNLYATLAEVAGLWNLVSHILEGTNIKHILMRNLIKQDQLHQIHHGNLTITCIHSIVVITKITYIHQQTDSISYISLAKWWVKLKEFVVLRKQLQYYVEFLIYIYLQFKGEILLHWALFLAYLFAYSFAKHFCIFSHVNTFLRAWDRIYKFKNVQMHRTDLQAFPF